MKFTKILLKSTAVFAFVMSTGITESNAMPSMKSLKKAASTATSAAGITVVPAANLETVCTNAKTATVNKAPDVMAQFCMKDAQAIRENQKFASIFKMANCKMTPAKDKTQLPTWAPNPTKLNKDFPLCQYLADSGTYYAHERACNVFKIKTTTPSDDLIEKNADCKYLADHPLGNFPGSDADAPAPADESTPAATDDGSASAPATDDGSAPADDASAPTDDASAPADDASAPTDDASAPADDGSGN